MARAFLEVAERTGAGLVTVGNLYGYGRVDGPITPQAPVRPAGVKGQVRARMWADALAAHTAGRVRATELRASDYFGPGASAGMSMANDYVIGPAVRGTSTEVPSTYGKASHWDTSNSPAATISSKLPQGSAALPSPAALPFTGSA